MKLHLSNYILPLSVTASVFTNCSSATAPLNFQKPGKEQMVQRKEQVPLKKYSFFQILNA